MGTVTPVLTAGFNQSVLFALIKKTTMKFLTSVCLGICLIVLVLGQFLPQASARSIQKLAPPPPADAPCSGGVWNRLTGFWDCPAPRSIQTPAPPPPAGAPCSGGVWNRLTGFWDCPAPRSIQTPAPPPPAGAPCSGGVWNRLTGFW